MCPPLPLRNAKSQATGQGRGENFAGALYLPRPAFVGLLEPWPPLYSVKPVPIICFVVYFLLPSPNPRVRAFFAKKGAFAHKTQKYCTFSGLFTARLHCGVQAVFLFKKPAKKTKQKTGRQLAALFSMPQPGFFVTITGCPLVCCSAFPLLRVSVLQSRRGWMLLQRPFLSALSTQLPVRRASEQLLQPKHNTRQWCWG